MGLNSPLTCTLPCQVSDYLRDDATADICIATLCDELELFCQSLFAAQCNEDDGEYVMRADTASCHVVQVRSRVLLLDMNNLCATHACTEFR